MFNSNFYVKFNGFVVPYSAFSCIIYLLIVQVVEIIAGGGGGQSDMFATPIF